MSHESTTQPPKLVRGAQGREGKLNGLEDPFKKTCTKYKDSFIPRVSQTPSSQSLLARNLAAALFLQIASPSPRQTSAHSPLHRSLCLAARLRERLSVSSKPTQTKYAGPASYKTSSTARMYIPVSEDTLHVPFSHVILILHCRTCVQQYSYSGT